MLHFFDKEVREEMVIYGVELVNRITVKKDGVYLSTHSRNDTAPYSSHRVGFLSDAYAEGGQKELDKQSFHAALRPCRTAGYA